MSTASERKIGLETLSPREAGNMAIGIMDDFIAQFKEKWGQDPAISDQLLGLNLTDLDSFFDPNRPRIAVSPVLRLAIDNASHTVGYYPKKLLSETELNYVPDLIDELSSESGFSISSYRGLLIGCKKDGDLLSDYIRLDDNYTSIVIEAYFDDLGNVVHGRIGISEGIFGDEEYNSKDDIEKAREFISPLIS